MKKVLSFVLVLAMILGCTAMAFAAPKTAASKVGAPFVDAPTSAVATILKDLGVLNGDENGKVNLADPITRAEFCKILMVALGQGNIGKVPTKTNFTDVPKDEWYSGYVAVANNLGYVDGRSANEFAPLESVTGNEAVAFVLKALGYDAKHLAGPWPTNYTTKANALGVLSDFEPTDDACTREEAFTLLFNALDTPIVKYNEKFYEDFRATGDTLVKVLGSTTDASVLYKDVEGCYVTKGATLTNGVSLADYEGKVVTLIKKNATAGAGTIGVKKVESVTLEGSFTDGTYTTFKAVDGTLYKYGKLNTTTVNAVYRNTDETLNATVSTIPTKMALTLEVKLSEKKDAIDTIYSAKYWTVDETVVVNATEAALFAKDNVASQAAALNLIDVQVSGGALYNFTLVGVDALDEIEEDAVIEIASAGGYAVKFTVTQNKFEGAVTKYNKKTAEFTVDGTAYKYAAGVAEDDLKSLNVNAAIKGATEFAFYLNSKDEIVRCKFTTEPKAKYDYRYAIVLEAKATQEQTLVNKSLKTVTNYAIALLPLDTMEEEVYEYVSAGSIANADILVEASGWKNAPNEAVETKAIVKIAVVDDELVKIATQDAFKPLDTDGDGDGVTFNANGFKGDVTKLYAADVQIVVGGVSGKKSSQAAYYVEKTVADLNKTTGTGFYLLNKDGKVEILVEAGLNVAAPAAKVVSAVAITYVGSDGDDYAEFTQHDGTEDWLYISGSAVTEANINTSLYALTLAGEKIASVAEVPAKTLSTVAGIKYVGGVLTTATASDETQCLDPVFFKWNKTDKVLEVVDYAEDIFKGATAVDTYTVGADFVDVIVIR